MPVSSAVQMQAAVTDWIAAFAAMTLQGALAINRIGMVLAML